MGKMLSFGTLFKGQNDPLGLFDNSDSKSNPVAVANSAKAQADLAAHNAALAATAVPEKAPDTTASEATITDELKKKKKDISLSTSLGLNL